MGLLWTILVTIAVGLVIGFLGKDAEVRTTQNTQARYTVLSLATKRSWRGRESGERLSQTTWNR